MKKTKFILFSVGIAFAAQLVAATKVPGYYITAQQDTVRGMFKIPTAGGSPNFERIEWGIKFISSTGEQIKLRAEKARVVVFTFNNKDYKMIGHKNTGVFKGPLLNYKKTIFLLVMVEEPYMNLYIYYRSRSHTHADHTNGVGVHHYQYSHTSHDVMFVLDNKQNDLLKSTWLNFKKRVGPYVSRCTDLAEKIKAGELNYTDMEKIVRQYNVCVGGVTE